MITLRYKSFKSEVAKRPPSSGTSGRNSGGITGITFKIIHSGRFSLLLFASLNDSTTFRRLRDSVLRCFDVSLLPAGRNSYESRTKSVLVNMSLIDSAHIAAIYSL